MVLILDTLPGGGFSVAVPTDKGPVLGKVYANGDITPELAVTFLEGAADTLATSIKQDDEHDNVTHIRPGDDDRAKKARILANQIRNKL